MHQNLIFDASRRIGGELDLFLRFEGFNRFDETDRADADQVLRLYAGVFKLFGKVYDQSQVVNDQLILCFPDGWRKRNASCFLFRIQRRRQSFVCMNVP